MAGKDKSTIPDEATRGAFTVDTARPLVSRVGRAAFAVRDRHGNERPDLMALPVARAAPARAHVITALAAGPVPGVLAPIAPCVANGADGRQALFILGQAPPGPPLSTWPEPWREAELIETVLRPAAAALEGLHARNLTHRAIRPDNMFRAGPGAPVVLGPFWAEPAASLQPALLEPPYVAMCAPSGRGDGAIADDVYALGVVLLVLALGRAPMADLDERDIIRRKLELGSYQALVGGARVPAPIADLLRGMLAEDPDHRPSPALLADPAMARTRRVAPRARRRAQTALEVGGVPAEDVRTLAWAMAREPERAITMLRDTTIEQWIRRGLGDAALAGKLEELIRRYPGSATAASSDDAMLLMLAIAVLDPLAPLCWRGVALWPGALGALLVGPDADRLAPHLEELVAREAVLPWMAARGGHGDVTAARLEARRTLALLRLPGWSGGRTRLAYTLNPLLPCASPLLDGQVVIGLSDLLPALEASTAAESGKDLPLDHDIRAMIAARQDSRPDADSADLARGRDPGAATLAALRLLAGLQTRFAPSQSFPRLAGWIARRAAPLVESWRNPGRRAKLAGSLATIAAPGNLPAMLALLDDSAARAADEREAAAAEESVRLIDAELARIAAEAPRRAELARRIGAELAAGAGAVALAASFVGMVLS